MFTSSVIHLRGHKTYHDAHLFVKVKVRIAFFTLIFCKHSYIKLYFVQLKIKNAFPYRYIKNVILYNTTFMIKNIKSLFIQFGSSFTKYLVASYGTRM